MLDSARLRQFMTGFYGYGSLSSDIWFIGMEEGGGNTEEEVAQRLNRWSELGRPAVVDIQQFANTAPALPMIRFFSNPPKRQKTWAGLIRVLLAVQDKDDDSNRAVLETQSTSWGRSSDTSDNCLLELLPLPSPSTSNWKYDLWSDRSAFPELCKRTEYHKQTVLGRSQRLRELVHDNRPRCVIFYGSSRRYLDYWSAIAGHDFRAEESHPVCHGRRGQELSALFHRVKHTAFVVMSHPNSRGITNEYFTCVGKAIADFKRFTPPPDLRE